MQSRSGLRSGNGVAGLGLALLTVACGACGERSGLFEVETIPPCSADAAAPVDAAAAPVDGASLVDAVAPRDGTTADAGEPSSDAGPSPLCHLVPAGEPFRTFQEPSYASTWAPHQEGLLVRRDPTQVSTPHVVQYVSSYPLQSSDWSDIALHATEYDVSVWPPQEVHAPTQLLSSEYTVGELVELPNGLLGLTWWDDPSKSAGNLYYATVNATSWEVGAQVPVTADRTPMWSAPVLTAGDQIALTYTGWKDNPDGGEPPAREENFVYLGLDGAVQGGNAPIWTAPPQDPNVPFGPQNTVVGTQTRTLVAVAFSDCDSPAVSSYCQPGSIVVLGATPSAAGPILETITSIPAHDPNLAPTAPKLLSDQQGHTWLTWWEASNLYAVALTETGLPASPIESWFAMDGAVYFVAVDDAAPIVSAPGPVGIVYPLRAPVPDDGGSPGIEEIHLVHRQLDAVAPIEDIVFTRESTGFPVVAVQTAQPRGIVVGYSSYATEYSGGDAELRRYTCAEDADAGD